MNKGDAKKMLFELQDILNACNVEFFLHCGTCLSAFRGDFQDGDEDIDLGVKHEHIVPKMKLLKETLAAHGYKMMIHSFPYIYERALKVVKDFDGVYIHADIIDYALNGKNRFHSHYKIDYSSVHDADLFDNLKTINFLGRDFLVPYHTEDFLEAIYGTDWRTPKRDLIFPKDWHNIKLGYWVTTPYSKATEMYHKRISAAFDAYKIELGSLIKDKNNG